MSRHYDICIGKYGLLSKETERFLSFFFDQHSDVHFIYVYLQFSIAAYRSEGGQTRGVMLQGQKTCVVHTGCGHTQRVKS